MANLLQSDARFGLQGNLSHQQGLRTLNQLLDPNQNQVSPLTRLQQERDILGAERQKKDAFRGDFAAAGLTGSAALGAIESAIGKTATTELAGAQFEENIAQEEQDRLALAQYIQIVLQPNITGQQLNEEEKALRTQLSQLKKSRRMGNTFGALKIVGAIAMTYFSAGTLAAPAATLAADGMSQMS